MSVFQVIFLGIVQSITEFLPISSSAHLFLFSRIFHWTDQGIGFDAAIHLGTLFAILLFFRKELKKIFFSIFGKKYYEYRTLLGKILLGTIPALVAGFLFREYIEHFFRIPMIIALQLIIWGIVMWRADSYSRKTKHHQGTAMHLSYGSAFIIGIAQACALMPGVSRSGATISAGLFCGLKRQAAAAYAFILGIPIIFGASVFSLFNMYQTGFQTVSWKEMLLGLAVSFLFGYAVIHFFLRYISTHNLHIFVWYRLILGSLILIFLFL